jgi:hypothetical protein
LMAVLLLQLPRPSLNMCEVLTFMLLDLPLLLVIADCAAGGSMLPIIPMLPGMFPFMLNPTGLQQGEGGMQADQLQAALAAMQQASGGLVAGSTPMMLTLPTGQEGDANAMSASQALQFAQLQGLTGNNQLPTLLQLTVQPDGGFMQANGQRVQLPGLGMPLQLPGGLQILSGLPEGLQLTTDANGNMQMMQVLGHDGSAGIPGADQAAVDAAVAAAAAAGGQAGLPLMAGLTAMGANILDPSALAAAAAAAGETDPAVLAAAADQAVVDAAVHEHAGAAAAVAAAAEAAAAQQAVVDASGVATSSAALQQALNMAAAAGGTVITADMAEQYAQQMAAAAAAPVAVQAEAQALADSAAAAAAAGQDAAAQAAAQVPELPLPQLTADAGGATLPAIAPLNTSSAAIADALKAVAGGQRAYNSAEEDAAAAALMSLATDKRKEAAQLLAQAQAATESGVIPEAAVNDMISKAHRLQEEAEAEERAAAAAAEAEVRAQLEQQHAAQLEAQHAAQLEAQQAAQQQGLQQQIEALQQQQLQQLQAAMAAQQQHEEVKMEGVDMGLQQAEQQQPQMEG